MSLQSKVSPWICVVISTSALRGEIFTTFKKGFSLRSKRQIVCYVIPGSTPGQVFDEYPLFLVISTSAFRGEIFVAVREGFSLRSKRQIVCYVIPGSTPGQVPDERPSRRDLHLHQARFLAPVETTFFECIVTRRRTYAPNGLCY